MPCQLTNMHELVLRNSGLNNLFQLRIKLVWSTKKKVIFLKNKLFHSIIRQKKTEALGIFGHTQIVPGDMIKVRSEEEIRSVLNDWGGYKGCIFTPEMYGHCNKTYRVFKKIDYFYDEVKQKMCKCKDIFLLEGILCGGQRKMFPSNCDRNCFLFWHSAWLQKLE